MIVTARVHIILARDGKTAIAIRRGPSKSVCTIQWDRRKDTFKLGQWLKGRIYERRCDLSPDGKHLIYFAMKGRWSSKGKGSWTAISQAPYLKAIGLWPSGNCWNGGGLFMTNRSYWLNKSRLGNETHQVPPRLTPHGDFPFHESYGGECPGVYYIRLQRDGWKLVDQSKDRLDGFSTFEKVLPKDWMLRKVAYATIDHPVGAGCYYDTHSIHHAGSNLTIDCIDWEWADLDGKRLTWIRKGVLYAARLTSKGIGFTHTLYDFNPLTFAAITAPY